MIVIEGFTVLTKSIAEAFTKNEGHKSSVEIFLRRYAR